MTERRILGIRIPSLLPDGYSVLKPLAEEAGKPEEIQKPLKLEVKDPPPPSKWDKWIKNLGWWR